MPARESVGYTVGFAAAVSVACALLVATAAVSLRERQDANAALFKQKNVMLAASLVQPGDGRSAAELQRLFEQRVRVRGVDLASGRPLADGAFDAAGYDQRKARSDPARSRPVPANDAKVVRVPTVGTVYEVTGDGGRVEQIVLPIEGMGMWGTMYGFLALGRDGNTVRGITFYEQKETPGLGGEIANPQWQALWVGRKAFDERWAPQLRVIKGSAGPPAQDPHRIDGLSGATITSNGVSHTVRFWLSEQGYGPLLRTLRGTAPPATATPAPATTTTPTG